MKRTIFTSAFAISIVLFSCKDKNKTGHTDSTEATTTTSATSPESSNQPANEPKSYSVTFTPDTAYLGKEKEVFVRLKNGKAVELSDADGKITGTELSYEIELTNKRKLGGNNVYINPSEFRLQLDNNTNITHDNYNSVSADAESTKSSVDNRFRLPAGTKPKSLNLFFDETRVVVGVEMK